MYPVGHVQELQEVRGVLAPGLQIQLFVGLVVSMSYNHRVDQVGTQSVVQGHVHAFDLVRIGDLAFQDGLGRRQLHSHLAVSVEASGNVVTDSTFDHHAHHAFDVSRTTKHIAVVGVVRNGYPGTRAGTFTHVGVLRAQGVEVRSTRLQVRDHVSVHQVGHCVILDPVVQVRRQFNVGHPVSERSCQLEGHATIALTVTSGNDESTIRDLHFADTAVQEQLVCSGLYDRHRTVGLVHEDNAFPVRRQGQHFRRRPHGGGFLHDVHVSGHQVIRHEFVGVQVDVAADRYWDTTEVSGLNLRQTEVNQVEGLVQQAIFGCLHVFGSYHLAIDRAGVGITNDGIEIRSGISQSLHGGYTSAVLLVQREGFISELLNQLGFTDTWGTPDHQRFPATIRHTHRQLQLARLQGVVENLLSCSITSHSLSSCLLTLQ